MDETGPKHFFFYGTLQAEHLSEVAKRLLPKFKRVGAASVPGRIFAIKAPHVTYPALIQAREGGPRVVGICYAMAESFTAEDMNALDAFEEYYPAAPKDSEYLRKPCLVTFENGETLDAWVYVYNFPVPSEAEPIPSGDFKAYADASLRTKAQ